MPYFGVRIEGIDVWVREEERTWFGLRRSTVERPVAFFATRFVEAADADGAETEVIALVRDEVRAMYCNPPGVPFHLYVDGVREHTYIPPKHLPFGGFSFYGPIGDEEACATALEIESPLLTGSPWSSDLSNDSPLPP